MANVETHYQRMDGYSGRDGNYVFLHTRRLRGGSVRLLGKSDSLI